MPTRIALALACCLVVECRAVARTALAEFELMWWPASPAKLRTEWHRLRRLPGAARWLSDGGGFLPHTYQVEPLTGWEGPSSGWTMTIGDLTRLMLAIQTGALLGPAASDDMMQVHGQIDVGPYGLGVFRLTKLSRSVFMHGGNMGGYTARYTMWPNDGVDPSAARLAQAMRRVHARRAPCLTHRGLPGSREVPPGDAGYPDPGPDAVWPERGGAEPGAARGLARRALTTAGPGRRGIMAVDEGLEERVRSLLEPFGPVGEKRMFGGLAFLIGGNMAALIIDSDLVVRVGPAAYEEALDEPGTRPFDFTGRSMRGWVVVTAEALSEDPELEAWLRGGTAYAASLPEKSPEA